MSDSASMAGPLPSAALARIVASTAMPSLRSWLSASWLPAGWRRRRAGASAPAGAPRGRCHRLIRAKKAGEDGAVAEGQPEIVSADQGGDLECDGLGLVVVMLENGADLGLDLTDADLPIGCGDQGKRPFERGEYPDMRNRLRQERGQKARYFRFVCWNKDFRTTNERKDPQIAGMDNHHLASPRSRL